jgi:hypothetical protein
MRRTYQSLSIIDFLSCWDLDRLDEELVAAFGIWRWVFFHSLEEHCSDEAHMSALPIALVARGGACAGFSGYEPDTSTSPPPSIRPEFGRTQYLAHIS